MGYTATTLAATANPAQDFMTALDALIVANGFTFVEAQTSGNITANVYKSPVATNGVADWYLIMYRPSNSSNSVYFSVCEAYDSTGHLMSKYPPPSQVAPSETTTYTYTSGTGVNPASGTGSYFSNAVALGTSGFQYWVSVNANRIIVATRVGTTDYGIYAGLADEMIPSGVAGQGVSLLTYTLSPQSSSGSYPGNFSAGGFTREPGQAASAAGNFAGSVSTTYYSWPLVYGGSTADPYTGQPAAGRVPINTCRGGFVYIRALLKDALYCFVTSAVNGDTITFGAKTYVKMCNTNSYYWVDNSV